MSSPRELIRLRLGYGVSGIGNALAADFADKSLNGFDRANAFAAHGQRRDIGQRFAAEPTVRRKNDVEEAGEAGRENATEGIGGLTRGRLRNKASSNRR